MSGPLDICESLYSLIICHSVDCKLNSSQIDLLGNWCLTGIVTLEDICGTNVIPCLRKQYIEREGGEGARIHKDSLARAVE